MAAGIALLRALLVVPDGPRGHPELPAGQLRHRPGVGRLGQLRTLFDDPLFWTAWKNTCYFTGLALVFGYAVPFFVAILLNEFRHAKGFLRVAGLPAGDAAADRRRAALPSSTTRATASSTRSSSGLHLPESQWMQSPTTAMLSLVLASTWMNMGGATLIYLAALQNIPGELYEAAELDGAGIWRRLRYVTLPQPAVHHARPAAAADRRDDAGVHRAATCSPATTQRRTRSR